MTLCLKQPFSCFLIDASIVYFVYSTLWSPTLASTDTHFVTFSLSPTPQCHKSPLKTIIMSIELNVSIELNATHVTMMQHMPLFSHVGATPCLLKSLFCLVPTTSRKYEIVEKHVWSTWREFLRAERPRSTGAGLRLRNLRHICRVFSSSATDLSNCVDVWAQDALRINNATKASLRIPSPPMATRLCIKWRGDPHWAIV